MPLPLPIPCWHLCDDETRSPLLSQETDITYVRHIILSPNAIELQQQSAMVPEQDEWAQSESITGHTNLVVTCIRRSIGIQSAQDIWGERGLVQIDLTEKKTSLTFAIT